MREYFIKEWLDLRENNYHVSFPLIFHFKSIRFLSDSFEVVLDIIRVNLLVINYCPFLPQGIYLYLDSDV